MQSFWRWLSVTALVLASMKGLRGCSSGVSRNGDSSSSPNEGEGIISCVASRASSRSVKGSTLLLCDSARRIACSIVYGGLGSTLVAPVENLHPDLFSQRKLRLPGEKLRAVLGSQSIVLHVDIEYDGELVVDIIPLYGFKPHFLGDHLAVALVEHVLLLAPHRTDHMTRGVENPLDKGVLPGRDLGPVGEGVALQIGVEIQQVIPAMGDAVDDDYLHASAFADTDGVDVFLGIVRLREGEHVVGSQVGIEVRTPVLGVNDSDFGPVGGHAVGDKERRIGLARSRSSLQG